MGGEPPSAHGVGGVPKVRHNNTDTVRKTETEYAKHTNKIHNEEMERTCSTIEEDVRK